MFEEEEEKKVVVVEEEEKFAAQKDSDTQSIFSIEGSATANYLSGYENREAISVLVTSDF